MERPWYSSYDSHIPHEVDITQYQSIMEIFEESFEKYADSGAFYNMGTTLTYAEINDLSKRFASYLQNDLGLAKGTRVAIMMPNILQYPIALFGSLRAGMVAVNVNPLYTARELEHQLNDSGAEVIVIFENSASTLQEVLAKTPVKHVITTQIGDMLKFPKSLIVNAVIKYVKKMVPAWNIPNTTKFKTALSLGNPDTYKRPELSQTDTAFLQYTGGTTGVAKGAILSHGNIVANMIQARAWISKDLNDGQEIVITPLPLYHIFSLTANCMVFGSIGALNVLITNPRDLDGFIKELKNWQFTVLSGVNTLFNGLLNHPEFANLDFSKFKFGLGGGMAVQKVVADKWKQVTKTPLIEAYGLTETSPAACINPLSIKDFTNKIGLPISSTDVKILDDDGNEVPVGEPGELAIKGPQVMQGYWQRPEETAKVMTADNFFKTGDVAFMDERGYFQIVDRKKDMILVSGFNVYPNEIEDVVAAHPKVLEVAAVGAPDEKSGEVVKLFIVKKDSSLTTDEVIAHCKENLTGYKVPRMVEFRDDLPKTNVGKILRKELRGQ